MVTKLKKQVIVEGEDDKSKLGLVQIYAGDGKGKTTASLGLALRAIGNGFKVYMIQFLKSGSTGELISSKKFEDFKIVQYGVDALKENKIQKTLGDFGLRDDKTKFIFEPDIKEKESCEKALQDVKEIISSKEYNIVILDEINCALDKGLIKVADVVEILKNHGKTELILTGRDPPKEIFEYADYISIIQRVKHPWQKGIKARKGIEY
ncbi:MAG: cob(I)yrinic acid a,c-diamide adenosyltransferase [Nanoarchaeota archaeon]